MMDYSSYRKEYIHPFAQSQGYTQDPHAYSASLATGYLLLQTKGVGLMNTLLEPCSLHGQFKVLNLFLQDCATVNLVIKSLIDQHPALRSDPGFLDACVTYLQARIIAAKTDHMCHPQAQDFRDLLRVYQYRRQLVSQSVVPSSSFNAHKFFNSCTLSARTTSSATGSTADTASEITTDTHTPGSHSSDSVASPPSASHSTADTAPHPTARSSLPRYDCPISFDVMSDPVVLVQTGMVYDRESIEGWFAHGGHTCPLTGQTLQSKTLAPVNLIRQANQAWCTGNGVALPPPAPHVYPPPPPRPPPVTETWFQRNVGQRWRWLWAELVGMTPIRVACLTVALFAYVCVHCGGWAVLSSWSLFLTPVIPSATTEVLFMGLVCLIYTAMVPLALRMWNNVRLEALATSFMVGLPLWASCFVTGLYIWVFFHYGGVDLVVRWSERLLPTICIATPDSMFLLSVVGVFCGVLATLDWLLWR